MNIHAFPSWYGSYCGDSHRPCRLGDLPSLLGSTRPVGAFSKAFLFLFFRPVGAYSKAANRLPPLSQVNLRSGADMAGDDLPPTAQSNAEWWKGVAMTAIAGSAGVLALVEVPATIQDMVDRWADGGSLAYTLPLTVLLLLLFLVAVIVL